MAQLMGKGETYQQKAKTKKGEGKKTARNLEKAAMLSKGYTKARSYGMLWGGTMIKFATPDIYRSRVL